MNIPLILMDALPIIKQFAPTIATAIGGPVGMAVGYALPVLSQVFGTQPNDIKGLAEKITSDPEAPAKLKQTEETHGDFIKTLIGSIQDLSSAEINVKLNWDTK